MNKQDLITKIIFGKEKLNEINFPVGEEEIKNFEIAWDIEQHMKEIKKEIRKQVAHLIFLKIKELKKDDFFKDFLLENQEDFLNDLDDPYLSFYPKNWIIENENEPLFTYFIGFSENDYRCLYYGIYKPNSQKPYRGERPNPRSNDILTELKNLQDKFVKKGFETDKYDFLWKYFDHSFCGKSIPIEDYNFVLENGVSSYIVAFIELIKETKEDLDIFIHKYKQYLSNA
ncbi:hypothetical protein [Persephonella sp.]